MTVEAFETKRISPIMLGQRMNRERRGYRKGPEGRQKKRNKLTSRVVSGNQVDGKASFKLRGGCSSVADSNLSGLCCTSDYRTLRK